MTITFEDANYSRDSGATRVNAAGLIVGVDFSTTSVTFGTGAKTFTLDADANVNRDWPVGSKVRATSQAAPLGLMNGTVTSYNAATQELVIEVTESTGTGDGADWRIGSLEFRRDFDPVTLATKGGLVEGGATNLVRFSQNLTNPYWSKSANVDLEAGFDFFGNNVAVKLTPTSSQTSGTNFFGRFSNITNFQLHHAYEVFVKSNGIRYFAISNLISWGGNPHLCAVVDLETNQVTVDTVSAGAVFVRDFAGGWKQIVVINNNTGTSGYDQLRFGAASSLNNNAVSSFVGNGVDGYFIAYPRARNTYSTFLELPIPTTTVAVSRAADLLAVDGSNFTQAYNQSQGTLLLECIPTASVNSGAIASINDGTAANEIRAGIKQSGTRSSIRAIASDGVTDVMGLNNTGNNMLRSNGVDCTEINTTLTAALAVASRGLGSFLQAGSVEFFAVSEDSGLTYTTKSMNGTFAGAHFGIGRFVIANSTSVNAGITRGSVIISTDGLSFRRINIDGLTQALNDVTSNGTNQYVAVGNAGVIYTSPDAENWTAQVSGTAQPLFGVHWFGGRYVAGSLLSNATRYSDDGITWTAVTGMPAAILDVYHNGVNLWVAVGGTGVIYSSPDGITWTQRTSPVSTALRGVHFADNLWVAVGDTGAVVTSPDGINWTNRSATSGTTVSLRGVGFFNGKFYYAGPDQVIGENTAAGIVAGTTWTLRTANTISNLTGIATNGSRLLICGSSGAITTSEDGITFTSRTGNLALLNGAAFGNGTYVVVGNGVNGSGLIATVDPVTFAYTRRTTPIGTGMNDILNVRFLNGKFFYVGKSKRQGNSSDGVTWTQIDAGNSGQSLTDIAFGNSVYVSVGVGFTTSANGETWSPTGGNNNAFGVTAQTMNGIAFANDLFVAVGNAGTIITSPNGTTWTLRTSGTTANLYAVHYSTRDQQWYATGDKGTILRSADATTWESISNDSVVGIFSDGELVVKSISAKLIPNQINRIAIGYDESGVSISVNGSNVTTDPSITMPLVDRLNIGTNGLLSQAVNAHIKTNLYRVKVSDAELQAMSRVF